MVETILTCCATSCISPFTITQFTDIGIILYRCAQFQLHEENEVLFLAKVNGEVANVHSISSDDEDD